MYIREIRGQKSQYLEAIRVHPCPSAVKSSNAWKTFVAKLPRMTNPPLEQRILTLLSQRLRLNPYGIFSARPVF